MKPLRVLLDCRSSLLKESFTALMREHQDFECIGFAQCRMKADVIVLLLLSNRPSELALIVSRAVEYGQVPILVVSVSTDAAFGISCISAGARGFLASDACRSEFAEAIRSTARGGNHLPAPLATMNGHNQKFPLRPLHRDLSGRELQVLKGYATGRGAKQIAGDLDVSTKTICTYRVRLLRKLCLSSNADLVLYAFTHDLLLAEAGGR